MKKKFYAAIALLAAVSLAACGGTSADNGSHSSAGSKTDIAESPDSGVAADSSAKSSATGTVKKGSGKLIVYSALNEDNTIALKDQFKKDTGIDIEP